MTMISLEQYNEAMEQKKKADVLIKTYCREQQSIFYERLEKNPVFTEDELVYARFARCLCGAGLAYPKGCPPDHYWSCAKLLKGIVGEKIEHCADYPFSRFRIQKETDLESTREL